MELTQQNRSGFRFPAIVIRLQFPFYLRLTLSLLLVSMFSGTIVLALSRLQPPPTNPFGVYDDLIGKDGNSPITWSNYETLFQAAHDLACATQLETGSCRYQSETGPFVVVSRTGLRTAGATSDYDYQDSGTDYRARSSGASGIYFAIRPNALTVGDVALLWGRPTIKPLDNWLFLHWPNQRISTWVESWRFNYALPLPYLFLEAPRDQQA